MALIKLRLNLGDQDLSYSFGVSQSTVSRYITKWIKSWLNKAMNNNKHNFLQVVHGNGESEIVCLWITQFEDKETVTELMQEFKKYNENWCLIECIMSDKDMTERNVLKKEISQPKLMICLFHTLRTMRCEVSCDKLGISQAERSMCLELLTKMAYANSEENYSELYAELRKCTTESYGLLQ